MKYWIFQNNQVLGPYEPDEMGKISVFSPESLVCPEGRRGTSMGDWQRAGMVPDLSVALVRATSNAGGKTAVLSIAGLPPEPTLKDLAQLGSIQEKVAMLEEVVLQLQEGLRAKDAELSSVHQELAGKSLESSEIKGEAAARQREADELKRQIAGLEDRLSSVRLLSETLDKAVEEERKVEHDVEKQGQALTDLVRDVEELRRQLEESKARQAALPAPATMDSPKANQPAPPLGDIVPPPPASAAVTPVPVPSPAAPIEFPTMTSEALPSFDASMPSMPGSAAAPNAMPGFDPMAFGDAAAGALAPDATPAPAAEAEPFGVVPPPPAPKGKKALLIGAVAGLAALGGLAVMGGFVPGLRKPKAPAAVLEPTPLPPPEPAPMPVAAPDPRQLAVDFAKAWPLPGDRTLERALEDLAPSAGNLSPWMADPLAGSRVQVNYFARSSAPGAPTIAYEFEVDLEGKTLVGRNAAAKSILTGKAAAPPAPPKAKPVKVKPKAPAVKKAPEEATLDSLLGGDAKKEPQPDHAGGGSTLTDAGDAAPAESAPEATPRPARANPARRAAKAKGGKASSKEQPADESLLDDLLKE
ncbi:MAG: hypothetical protein PHS14_08460 [Elusimicrobia bacterium]|nr:hypothetical protein [Elusimicrobiota bacterium]